MEKLYPNKYMYKIIFKVAEFERKKFLENLIEKKLLKKIEDYEEKSSKGGKYTSLTFTFFIENEKIADELNKMIYDTKGIFNYFTVILEEESA